MYEKRSINRKQTQVTAGGDYEKLLLPTITIPYGELLTKGSVRQFSIVALEARGRRGRNTPHHRNAMVQVRILPNGPTRWHTGAYHRP